MAETPLHRDELYGTFESLDYFYREDSNIYVSANMLLFYEEGNRNKHISPDVFVAFGVPKKLRDYFMLWEEPRGPNVVFEMTSKTTKREDLAKKPPLYRDVFKIDEYFLFDPTEDYLKPPLQGFRLTDGDYQPILMESGRLKSEQLNMWVERDGVHLRLRDARTGLLLPTFEERVEQAKNLAEQEKQRADALAVEVERLKQQLRERAK